ncbi:restriction endonuclease subunit S [uncultured Sphaerochaeta sp.]|uniref:restriction endonuclease subunit S n=1 Tax=uncultured Sphaerochaeta sp. TaxID=886478 RepID=UPI002A0A707E|nr:restriction endonuclease subunit S [uncultured Sphaerochaeta sp.]
MEIDYLKNFQLYTPYFPSKWTQIPLYELATWVNGLAFREINFSKIGRPIIKISEIKNGISVQTKFTDSSYNNSIFIQKGDMLFCWSGQPETSIDIHYWREMEGWLNQHIYKIIVKKICEPDFFYYIMKYIKPNLISIARNKQTTGLGHVTKKDLQSIIVSYPEIKLQKAISKILVPLDAQIDLLNKMNETLESMARALFKSWFVDFDPVRKKVAGEPTGLSPEIDALFPDSFEESELGDIPKGWQIKDIGEVVDIVGGSTPSTKKTSFWNGDFSFATPKDLSNADSPILINTERKITEQGVSQISSQLLPKGTLLLSSRAPIGYLSLTDIPVSINQGFIAVKKESKLPPNYMYFWLKENMELIKGNANGTTFQEISKSNFRMIKTIFPNNEIIDNFKNYITIIIKQITNNTYESKNLKNLRDNLLPKLISGELEIPDIDAILEKAK